MGTVIIVVVNVVLGIVNYWLNLTIVVAPFGVEAFNQQVAQVNAITRVLFPIPSIASFGLALFIIYRAAHRQLPLEPGESPWEADFWALMARRAALRQSPTSDQA